MPTEEDAEQGDRSVRMPPVNKRPNGKTHALPGAPKGSPGKTVLAVAGILTVAGHIARHLARNGASSNRSAP